jgi:hypothetical protein
MDSMVPLRTRNCVMDRETRSRSKHSDHARKVVRKFQKCTQTGGEGGKQRVIMSGVDILQDEVRIA